MNSFDFRLPWPPTLNTYYVCIHGRKVLSKKGRLYSLDVKKLAYAAGVNFKIDVPIEVEIGLAPPRNGKWDGDNYIKALFDAMVNAEIIVDDSLIEFYSVRKLKPYALGEVYITVSTIE